MLKETAGFQAGEHDERGAGSRKPKAKDAAAEKYIREAAKLLGITVGEARQRIEQGRKAQAEDDRQKQAEGVQKSIKYNVEQIDECLSDVEDMANALRQGDYGCVDPMTAAHGIFAVAGRASEFLRDLCGDLGLQIEVKG